MLANFRLNGNIPHDQAYKIEYTELRNFTHNLFAQNLSNCNSLITLTSIITSTIKSNGSGMNKCSPISVGYPLKINPS
jgi:hypothetical protein